METQIQDAIAEVARISELYGYALGQGKHSETQLKAMVGRVHLAREHALELVRTYALRQHEAGMDFARATERATR